MQVPSKSEYEGGEGSSE
uniref:Uncharacterized protein n=1 Tax=Anguilla anguilla TaxID=7936 RepID=A0A0E9U4R7_ANGAN